MIRINDRRINDDRKIDDENRCSIRRSYLVGSIGKAAQDSYSHRKVAQDSINVRIYGLIDDENRCSIRRSNLVGSIGKAAQDSYSLPKAAHDSYRARLVSLLYKSE